MMLAAMEISWAPSLVMFLMTVAAIFMGIRPLLAHVQRQEEQFDRVLRGNLLLKVAPRTATWVSVAAMVLLGVAGYAITGSAFGAIVVGVLAAFLPSMTLRMLRQRHLAKLERQLVSGIQTLGSGVRAGLNLVQSMGLVARDGPSPLRDEFAHLLREYEYGTPLEEAMDKCATRIGSGDFRLLFAALQTHRERGGDLGETLDRIADSIREIQRLESRVETLTAEGRANSRMLGMLVVAALGILYLIDANGVKSLFEDDIGKVIIGIMVFLNVVGFLWIRWIIAIDI
jgi:tight adherence protein B